MSTECGHADTDSMYKLFTASSDALAAVLQRMQMCFYGEASTEEAARHADAIIHHLQQDLVGNLCTIMQLHNSSEASEKGAAAVVSALQVRICTSKVLDLGLYLFSLEPFSV